jgi:hypothetical protein
VARLGALLELGDRPFVHSAGVLGGDEPREVVRIVHDYSRRLIVTTSVPD